MRLAILAGTLILLGGLGFAIDAQSRARVERPATPPQRSTISAAGRFEGATLEVELRPQLSGRVDEVLVHEGQTVSKGELLLRLDARQYRHEVAAATAELRLAEAQLDRLRNGAQAEERREAAALHQAKAAELEYAQLSYNRLAGLYETKSVSKQEYDDTRGRVARLTAEVEAAAARVAMLEAPARTDETAMAQARVAGAQAKLEIARTQLDRAELTAPGPGQILRIDVKPGELADPASAEPALVMVDTTRPHVRAFVEEFDAPRVAVGMPAAVTVDGLPDRRFQGRVVRVSAHMRRKEYWSDRSTERQDTKIREVWIELEPCDAFVIGLPVEVVIDLEEAPASMPDGRTSLPSSLNK